jgi:hypothetical protein
MTRVRSIFGWVAACGASSFAACLPADTRPPPGKLTMTVSASDATLNGVTTADGWSVSFDRVLVAMGHTSLDSSCTSYSDPRYYRLLDLGAAQTQTLGLLFGLGDCDLQFHIAPPDVDTVLGTGVTDADETFMRTAITDSYFINAGVSVDIAGHAVRDAAAVRFHWTFRPSVRYAQCSLVQNGQTIDGVSLHGGDDFTYDVRIETEALFRDNINADRATLRFQPIADADAAGNADGEVTLDELNLVAGSLTATGDFSDISWSAGASTPSNDGGRSVAPASLEDFVYLFLVPTMPRFRDVGHCSYFPRNF